VDARHVQIDARQAELNEDQSELERQRTGLDKREAVLDARQVRLDARQADLNESHAEFERQQSELDEREAGLDARDSMLKLCETRTQDREREADAIIGVAEGIASGQIEIDEPSDDPDRSDDQKLTPVLRGSPVEALRAKSAKGVLRAATAFSATWTKLRERGREEAEDALTVDREEIAAADQAIFEAASLLPPATKAVVAKLRANLAMRIRTLGRRAEARAAGDPSTRSTKRPDGQSPVGGD
jgi:hypothetical protein